MGISKYNALIRKRLKIQRCYRRNESTLLFLTFSFSCIYEKNISLQVSYDSDFCRIPIIDYHRHCGNCSYDICLKCCQDVRKASKDVSRTHTDEGQKDTNTLEKQDNSLKQKMRLSIKLCDWKANNDGSVPCPPKEHGGCGNSPLTLKRIFKMNWVAKLVKNVDEMVSGCKNYDIAPPNGVSSSLFQDVKSQGISEFIKNWVNGQPVIVKGVCDESSMLGWDPMVMWKGIQETNDEKMKDDNRIVKAIDCLDRSEIDIELGDFIKGYSEGRIRENGQPEMLLLKNWPSPSASEEFLLYQRPEFITKLPLLEYIHSKWGLLNLAAKLPHYSLHNDVGPKILISYGMPEEKGQGDSVNMLRFNMRDVVYLLVHTCEVNRKNEEEIIVDSVDDDRIENEKGLKCEDLNRISEDTGTKSRPGAIWEIYRREDVPKLIEYMRLHWNEFGVPDNNIMDDSVRVCFFLT